MSHLKFNADVVKALIKKGTHFTPKAITTVGAFISNPKGLHYSIEWIGTSRIKKVVCGVYNKSELVLSY